MNRWQAYWFAPAPCLDLAVVRVIAVAVQVALLPGTLAGTSLDRFEGFDQAYWDPVLIQRLLNLLLGIDGRPPLALVQSAHTVALVAGIAAVVGLATNLSLAVLVAAVVYVQSFLYSFGDYHHREAIMAIALGALAISPSGHALSVDAWLRRRLGWRPAPERSEFAGWPIKLIGWWFVLMYMSAVIGKFFHGGFDWVNGYTLQYYLAVDGLQKDRPLGVWLSQFHEIVFAVQVVVVVFQATFVVTMLWPRSRWLYVPLGIAMHTSIYILMKPAFWQWIALYSVFVPWTEARDWLAARLARPHLAATP